MLIKKTSWKEDSNIQNFIILWKNSKKLWGVGSEAVILKHHFSFIYYIYIWCLAPLAFDSSNTVPVTPFLIVTFLTVLDSSKLWGCEEKRVSQNQQQLHVVHGALCSFGDSFSKVNIFICVWRCLQIVWNVAACFFQSWHLHLAEHNLHHEWIHHQCFSKDKMTKKAGDNQNLNPKYVIEIYRNDSILHSLLVVICFQLICFRQSWRMFPSVHWPDWCRGQELWILDSTGAAWRRRWAAVCSSPSSLLPETHSWTKLPPSPPQWAARDLQPAGRGRGETDTPAGSPAGQEDPSGCSCDPRSWERSNSPDQLRVRCKHGHWSANPWSERKEPPNAGWPALRSSAAGAEWGRSPRCKCRALLQDMLHSLTCLKKCCVHWLTFMYLLLGLHAQQGTAQTGRFAGPAGSFQLHSVLTAQWCPRQADPPSTAHQELDSLHRVWVQTHTCNTHRAAAAGLSRDTQRKHLPWTTPPPRTHRLTWERGVSSAGVCSRCEQLMHLRMGQPSESLDIHSRQGQDFPDRLQISCRRRHVGLSNYSVALECVKHIIHLLT